MKKVLFYSKYDWANSGYKTCQAMWRYSEKYEVKYFAEQPHPFGYERGRTLVNHSNDRAYVDHEVVYNLMEWSKVADIVHFKGDEGVFHEIHDIDIDLDRPVVLTVCGRVWEKKHNEIWDRDGEYVDQLLATTPDHFTHGISGKVMPLPVDTDNIVPIDKAKDCVIIGFNPTSNRKGVKVVPDTLNRLKAQISNVYFNVHQQLPYSFLMQLKRINHVFIDQINDLGIYGNAGIESAAMGSAVMASHNFGAEGIVKVMNGDELFDELVKMCTDSEHLEQAQIACRKWVEDHHSYKAVAKKLGAIYDKVSQ